MLIEHSGQKYTPRSKVLLMLGAAGLFLGVSGLTAMPSDGSANGVVAPLASSGSVAGTVFYDRNNDAYYDGPSNSYQVVADNGVAGIIVRAFDSNGDLVGTATSGANGNYTLAVSGAATQDVRIEFEIPSTNADLAGFSQSLSNFYANYAGQSYGAVRFVKIGATRVDFGVHKPSEFCPNNPGLLTCLQPMGDAAGTSAPGVVAFKISSLWATNKAFDYGYNPNSVHASADQLGSVFGIGVDPAAHRRRSGVKPGNAFMGTYVKRHSEYGNAGATNTIYHVTVPQVGAGTVSSFVTLPGTLPAHDATPAPTMTGVSYSGDTGVFSRVGRIGLGDVDVMDDAETLLAIDMDETAPKLFFVPIVERVDGSLEAGTPSSIAIPAPATYAGVPCIGTWHPMGIGTRDARILVGGVCGAETTVTPSEPNGPHPTQSAAFVMEYSGTVGGVGSFTTIFATGLGQERGCAYLSGPCQHSTSKVGTLFTADWGAWNEYPQYDAAGSVSNPQAMLANIEITDSGDLILGFRDRSGDQLKTGSAAWSDAYLVGSPYSDYADPPFSYGKGAYNFGAGDMLRVCRSAGTYSLEANGTCAGGLPGSESLDGAGVKEYYYDSYPHASGGVDLHAETVSGSTATLPGYDGVWATAWDVSKLEQQGVLSFGSCADMIDGGTGGVCYPSGSSTGYGSRIGGIGLPFGGGSVTWPANSGFLKGSGLADLEVICDDAPVMVGNSVWNDLNDNGIRDPGEPAIAGVTVNLYNSSGTLVGTAKTDSQGIYAFMSHFSGLGYIGGGLVAGEQFTIKMDHAADYLNGGPLYNFSPAWSGATTASPFDNEKEIDSDGVVTGTGTTLGVDAWPTIVISPLSAGENATSFDFGMNKIERVAVDGTLWVDTDSDGIRDVGEVPLAGVVVTLYEADGVTRLLRPDGTPATATTAADGSYFIDDLLPGDYRALFTLPSGYVFTAQGVGSDAAVDSNPDPLTGMTPLFTVTASVSGETIADTDTATRAVFVLPNLDAGVVPLVAMGDVVWVDADSDGVQDVGEVPLAGVVVALYEADGVTPALRYDGAPATATTAADGSYVIDGLLPGDYRASFTLPSGYVFTAQGVGSDAAVDSNPDPSTGLTAVFSIAPSVFGDTVANTDVSLNATFVNPTIDAGVVPIPPEIVPPAEIVPKVSVGDYVWFDVDGDGIQDLGEPGIAGVLVRITFADGSAVTDASGNPVTTTTTDVNGKYLFANLPPGTFKVSVVAPAGYAATKVGSGSRSDDSSSGDATSLDLTFDGAEDLTLDFGFVKTEELGSSEEQSFATAPALEAKTAPGTAYSFIPEEVAVASEGATFDSELTRVGVPGSGAWSKRLSVRGGTWTVEKNRIRFTPKSDFLGRSTVAYRLVDTAGRSVESTLTVTVTESAMIPATGADPWRGAFLAVICILGGALPSLYRRHHRQKPF